MDVKQDIRGGSLCLPAEPVVDKSNGSKNVDILPQLILQNPMLQRCKREDDESITSHWSDMVAFYFPDLINTIKS